LHAQKEPHQNANISWMPWRMLALHPLQVTLPDHKEETPTVPKKYVSQRDLLWGSA